ncbi:MAG: hypothetical protein QOD09_3230 [Bradyrhizobium sp.]|nr:hypothetical protein [Bradyrhizobium sp.]
MLRLRPWRPRNGLRIRRGGPAPRPGRQTAAPARLPRARAALLWRRPRRFGWRVDPAPQTQALTLQFGLRLNLMLNMAAATQPHPVRTVAVTSSATRAVPSFELAARDAAGRLVTLRHYLFRFGSATPASIGGPAATRSAVASSRAQAPALQWSHRLQLLLNMTTGTRQILQRIVSVAAGGTGAAAVFDPARRHHASTAPALQWSHRLQLLLNMTTGTRQILQRIAGIAARHRMLTPRRSIPARAMALAATRWFGEAARAGATTDRGGWHASRRGGGVLAETRSARRRNRPSQPSGRPRAERTPSRPAALRAATRAFSEAPRRLFGRPLGRAALTEPGRRTADQFHHETPGTQPPAPISLAWRRAPSGALAQDARAGASASMAARSSAVHAVMPAASPRDAPSALNARMPRPTGAPFDSAMMNRLTHEVIGRIEQKMRIERERRGL